MSSNLHVVLSGRPSEARTLRDMLNRWLAGFEVNGAVGKDIVTAVSEAFANAVEHPRDRRSAEVVIDAAMESSGVVVQVRDHGRWQDELDPARGHYGLSLMEGLMDAVVVERSQLGTVVTLRRAISR